MSAFKVGDRVTSTDPHPLVYPFGKVIAIIPGGYEVAWTDDRGNKAKPFSTSFENSQTITKGT